jgi:hypothetical protein
VNAAMILSGMGPLGELKTTAGKVFAGSYAIFSGLIIVIATRAMPQEWLARRSAAQNINN